MNKIFRIVIALCFVSCASYQTGEKAQVVSDNNETNEEVVVTGEINSEFTTDYFTFVQVNFGNKSDDWKDITKITLNSNDPDIKIILGPRLKDWNKSIRHKVAIDRYNKEVLIGSIAAVAAVGMADNANQGNFANTEAYGALLAGTAIASDINQISNRLTDLERARLFPSNHLMSPFSVPPGLYSRRWILLQIKKGLRLVSISFDAHYKSGEKKTYNIRLVSSK